MEIRRESRLFAIFLISIIVLNKSASASGLKGWGGAAHFGRAPILERFSWQVLDWAYPDPMSRAAALESGDYMPENGLPVGIEVWNNKLFVTVPRWKDG